jgi:hypothetical protein
MALTVRKPLHKIISKGGAAIWLPASCFTSFPMTIPDVYAQDSAQVYPMGTKLEYADGRVFRYGKVGATSTSAPLARLVGNANAAPGCTGEEDVDGYEGNLYAAVAVGDTYCDLYQNQADVENFYEDGMIAVFPSGHYVEYRIAGNELGNGTYVRVYIDSLNGFRTAMTAGTAESTGGTGVTAYKSIYSQMKQIGAEGTGYMSAIGMCLATGFTVNYFAWIQRRGRCLIGGGGGGSTQYRTVTYNPSDGYGADAATYDPTSGYQMIGYWTQRTVSGYGDLEVWLNFE